MKLPIIAVLIINCVLSFWPDAMFAQPKNEVVGPGFSKGNARSIEKKMNKLMGRVSEQAQCPCDSITYTIVDKYETFYSKSSRHLPKLVRLNACGREYTYKHRGLSGAVLFWLIGSWKQVEN